VLQSRRLLFLALTASLAVAGPGGTALAGDSTGPAHRPLVLGYVETPRGGATARDLNLAAVDVVIHAFLYPDAEGAVRESESFARTSREGIAAAARAAGKRIFASVGGATLSGSFGPLAASPDLRRRFARALAEKVRALGYDGVDLDWESPSVDERASFTALVREVRAALRAISPDLALVFGTGPGWSLDSYDFAALADATDLCILFGYDWNNPANGPLTTSAHQWTAGGSVIEASVRGALDHVIARGYPPAKLVMGIPFYSSGKPQRSWYEVRGTWLARDPAPDPAFREALIEGAYWNTPRAIEAKLDGVLTRSGSVLTGGAVLGGVAVWELGHEGRAGDLSGAIRAWIEKR
jgi:chitinase